MWDFTLKKSAAPRYLAIADALEKEIFSGEYPPGRRLMTHRELARAAGVTVSTATKAYAELERRGLVRTMVGRGTFVSAEAPATSLQAAAGNSVIEMGLAMPIPEAEPSIRPLLHKLNQEEDIDGLVMTCSPVGHLRHREIGAGWLRRAGAAVSADSVLITAGHQHSLFSVLHGLFSPGDGIAVDQLINPGFKTLAAQAGLELAGVEMDADGMLPAALDALCREKKLQGIYITGNIQNPSARPIPPERQRELAEVISRHGLILVEDDSFHILDSGKTTCVSAFAPEAGVYFSSFSSGIYAGLRVAFMHAPPKFYSKLAQAVVENIWTVSPLCVALACASITSGTADKAFQQKRSEVARRARMFANTLAEFDISCSERFIYAWIRLPKPWHGKDFEHAAERNGVRVFSAERFTVAGSSAPDCVRVALTGPPNIHAFRSGLHILSNLLKREGVVITPIW